jgi:aminoglycoside phosphotransferase (APT) family kinase protein
MEENVQIDEPLVRGLLQAQLPKWADLPLSAVVSSGTDNAIFRLGRDMVVRLPKVEWAIGQAAREHRWLSSLAADLPLQIPSPLVLGSPGGRYPWQWSVHSWIDGFTATRDGLDQFEAADRLAHFVSATRAINAEDGPPSGAANSQRGVPLAERDAHVRRALKQLKCEPNVQAASAVWDDALCAAPWSDKPAWLHGDLQPSNLIINDSQLNAVIDFGLMGIGDPACDLMAAWTCFRGAIRQRFIAAVGADDDALRRGRGWAVSTAVVALASYAETNAAMAAQSRATLVEVCSHGSSN